MPTQNNNIDNVSDVRPDGGTNANVSPQSLPIRGEKRIIPCPVDPGVANAEAEQQYTASGLTPPNKLGYQGIGRTQLIEPSDYDIHAALAPYTDYVVVRLYNRGLGGNGQPDGCPAVYRFLSNPSQVVVNRTTLDGQALARSGWQVGVWGEDIFTVNLTGKTAGQYFSFGITDTKYQPYSESYRNLEQLQVVFENNGYWFEGEQAAEGPLAAPFTRRVIKMHSDVELIVGNFMWYGMFESLTVSQDAQMPFLMSYQISFIAWKERFRKGSPYKDLIHNDIKRAHDFGAWQPAAISTQMQTQTLGAAQSVTLPPAMAPDSTTPTNNAIPPLIARPVPIAVQAAEDANTYSQVSPDAVDTTYTTPVLGYTNPINFGTWNGILSPRPFGNGG